MSREGRASAKQLRRESNDDRFWIYSLATVAALMLAVMAYRVYEDHKSPLDRYGVPMLEAERTGPQVLVPIANVYDVIAVKSDGVEMFLVKVNDFTYMAYETLSRSGRKIRYDSERGFFVDAKRPTIGFDKGTGASLSPDVQDELRKFIVRPVPDFLEVTLAGE